MIYNYREQEHERENTTFSAEGVVKTADGKENEHYCRTKYES